jgi:O-antigen/teichoic acid export membrane protein
MLRLSLDIVLQELRALMLCPSLGVPNKSATNDGAGSRQFGRTEWVLADQAMVSGSNFITGILLARAMGLESFGLFTLAWMTVQFVNSFQVATITSPMLSIGPKQTKEERPGYYGAVLVKQLIFSILSFTLLIAGAFLSQHIFPEWNGELLALPLATTAVAYQMQDFIRRQFFACGQIIQAFNNDLISYVGQLLIFLLMAQVTEIDSIKAIWVIGATSGLAVFVGLWGMQPVVINRHVFRKVIIRHWHFSKWLLLKVHLNQFTSYPLIWALGVFRGTEAVGILTASKNIVAVLHIIYLSLDNIVQPRASHLMVSSGLKATIHSILKITQLAGIPVIAVCLGVAFLPGQIATLFYGDILRGHEEVVVLFAVAYFLIFLEKPLAYILMALEKTRMMAMADGAKFILAITLGFPIVKIYGAMGVMSLIVIANVLGIAILLIGCTKSLTSYSSKLRGI